MKISRPQAPAYDSFDHLATMVAVLRPDGRCVYVNATFEAALGVPRKALQKGDVFDWFVDDTTLRSTFASVVNNEFSTGRFEALMRRPPGGPADPLPVHVIITQIDHGEQVLLELVEVEQQARQERETRTLDQARVTKELIRNLAHEIKNPLGGIRGAAQLLEMELDDPALIEYTQVIIHEADRLQALVDRLLAPHRRPHIVADVNIHEVLERVRSLVLAEFSRGLKVVRDYDASLPEFRGDREQLIQAVLNIMHNAAQALSQRRQDGDAVIILRTRAGRQVTIGKQRYRLALELHIEDNGPGVPSEIRDRIFFPLVSGRDSGSGLGLTLAQDFVQQHHGLIECESESGRTVFKIQIPLP
ncbi:nitrogen specific signal transduction histidine kinase NtrB [Sphaerotilus hippei]|uniref:Sensory histidine kinase/phosphatase NtrB n=1 Tax=Sphaerotilus hippei TaxID=744406 RepID=A0A318H087_9BURK|nr:nitrogen regulation protein NR(II) [Sphaerotilus hippei]PXW94563.1 nitrogen specific signal transduction histidine kinase NtrB [Sphaerotilus hippei]